MSETKGDKGDKGCRGVKGEKGDPGTKGLRGHAGHNGRWLYFALGLAFIVALLIATGTYQHTIHLLTDINNQNISRHIQTDGSLQTIQSKIQALQAEVIKLMKLVQALKSPF